jgi:L-fucose mutarotase
LAAAGHGSQVLIADGGYPVSTAKGVNTRVVHLNLIPGKMQVAEVLAALLPVLPVESAKVMAVPPGAEKPAVWEEFRRLFLEHGMAFPLETVERFAFYDEVAGQRTALIIQTGDTRSYANLLLTMGAQ